MNLVGLFTAQLPSFPPNNWPVHFHRLRSYDLMGGLKLFVTTIISVACKVKIVGNVLIAVFYDFCICVSVQ